MKPDQSDGANATMSDPDGANTLAQAQAKAADKYTAEESINAQIKMMENRPTQRCLFGHSVPANQGYETKAGYVCAAHSSSFDNE